MAFLVNITRRAERDLGHIYEEINAEESDVALIWYRGLKDAMLSPEHLPARCPVTPEDAHLRHLLYGKKPHVYRVIFEIDEPRKVVKVLTIRHGARDKFTADEL